MVSSGGVDWQGWLQRGVPLFVVQGPQELRREANKSGQFGRREHQILDQRGRRDEEAEESREVHSNVRLRARSSQTRALHRNGARLDRSQQNLQNRNPKAQVRARARAIVLLEEDARSRAGYSPSRHNS